MAKAGPIRVPIDTEQIDAKIAELKEAARGANEVLADIKAVLKEVRGVKLDLERVEVVTAKKLELHMEVCAKSEIEQLHESTKQAMRDAVDRVNGEFDKLRDILLGMEPGDEGETIPDLINRLPNCRRCGRKETPGGHKCERVVPDAT